MYNNIPDRDPNPPENRTRLVTIHWKAEVWGSMELEVYADDTDAEIEKEWLTTGCRFDLERGLIKLPNVEDASVEIDGIERHGPDPFEYMED